MLRGGVTRQRLDLVTCRAIRRFSSYSPKSFYERIDGELEAIRNAGTFKSERVLLSPQNSQIQVQRTADNPQSVINFCANNYLGLCDNPGRILMSKRTRFHR